MPELPEVETIRRDLVKLIVGRKVIDIDTDTPKMVTPSLAVVKKAIVGAKIVSIKRRAKLLFLNLSNGKTLAIHLKLTGRLLVRDSKDPKDDWQHVTIFLTGDNQLRFADLRKFGWVKLLDKKNVVKVLEEFGPEPLDDLTLSKFSEILISTRRPIKVLLLDQKKISGIGNIYACDALWLAGIFPEKKANELNHVETKKLYKAVETVFLKGIKYRGASDNYYLDALGRKGSYQKHFLVYGRVGESCDRCKNEIKRSKIRGRGTFYCPVCQK